MEDIFKPVERYYEDHIMVRFIGVNINENLNIIRTRKEIEQQIGTPKRILRAGRESLMIETFSATQTTKLKEMKKIAGHPVEIKPHKVFNTVKGVVRSRAFSHNTIEELKNDLAEQGVADVVRLTTKREGEIQTTDTYILTFLRKELPKVIILGGFHREIVQEYKHRPQQCYKCQKFGHIAKYCRKENEVCCKCGEEGHNRTNCRNSIKCYHCEGHHYASDRICPKYLCEESILGKQMKEKIPREDAMELIFRNHPEYEVLYEKPRTTQPLTVAAVVAGRTRVNDEMTTPAISTRNDTLPEKQSTEIQEKKKENILLKKQGTQLNKHDNNKGKVERGTKPKTNTDIDKSVKIIKENDKARSSSSTSKVNLTAYSSDEENIECGAGGKKRMASSPLSNKQNKIPAFDNSNNRDKERNYQTIPVIGNITSTNINRTPTDRNTNKR